MARWAQSVSDRDQIVLFAPTLDHSVAEDHPVRLFEELLGKLDFSSWESRYVLTEGQPPIHPRIMASVLLYGWTLGIRSSRKLEDATANRIDVIWLTSGRVIDHSTLAGFRVRFGAELKDLFKQVGRVAIHMGMANLNRVALDGTVKRSSNVRSKVAKRASLEQKLAALDQQVETLMKEAGEIDEAENKLFGESSPTKLPKQLKDLQKRQEQLAAAPKKLAETDARQKAKGRGKKDGPAVPVTDVDSSLMKNKTGGFAPNHLIILGTESQNGFIVDYEVPADADEPAAVMPAMQRIQEAFGPGQPAGDAEADSVKTEDATIADAIKEDATEADATEENAIKEDTTIDAVKPAAAGEAAADTAAAGEAAFDQTPSHVVKQLLADTNFNTGPNLRDLTAAGIEPWMPARQPAAEEPAAPQPPNQPAPDQMSDQTPDRSSKPAKPKSLDKSLFVYNAQHDQYICPAGRPLPFARSGTDQRKEGPLHFRTYQCADCSNCALSSRCLGDKAKTRSIRRDEHEPLREQMAARMATDAGKSIYKQRCHIAETPFAVMNTTMNFTRFLLRGVAKSNIELGWFSTAHNLKKLVRLLRSNPPARTPA